MQSCGQTRNLHFIGLLDKKNETNYEESIYSNGTTSPIARASIPLNDCGGRDSKYRDY
jgi:hypothetical protein